VCYIDGSFPMLVSFNITYTENLSGILILGALKCLL
ncbi:uncharacterized protein METZ01_LOCUS207107, partial [marine metagenome]